MKNLWPHLKSILGLSLQLAKANFKLKNEGSFLGIFWYLLEPLFLFLIILSIRGALSSSPIPNYPIYLLLGLIMFNFFSTTTNIATKTITNSSNFIKSMKINHESLIISRILENIFAHFFEIILFIGFMIFFKLPIIWILTYPLIFIPYILFISGISFILSTISVYINDLNNAWRVITRLLFFATPLFYIAEKGTLICKLNLFNPLFYFITITRELIIYHEIPELSTIILIITSSTIVFIIGILIFNRYKNKFAEYI
jgi:ABC-type polysaccharide/polyol phosphate export permease